MQLHPFNVYNMKNCSKNMSKSLPCPWYCGCSSVSGSRYDRCCHQTNNNKTWSGTQPPNIHGRPSIILTSTAQSGTVLQKYDFAKWGDQFSASSDYLCSYRPKQWKVCKKGTLLEVFASHISTEAALSRGSDDVIMSHWSFLSIVSTLVAA